MFKIKARPDQIEYAKSLAGKLGKRGRHDGTPEMQETGMLAETVVADCLGIDRPIANGQFDGGFDLEMFGKKIDVKARHGITRAYLSPRFFINLNCSQKNYNSDIYLCTHRDKTTEEIWIGGLIDKKNLQQYFVKKGTTRTRADGTTHTAFYDNFEIPFSDLITFDKWQQLGSLLVDW